MIAVTGAAGFIGSHLAHRLARMGQELLLVDHPLVPAKQSNLEGLERFTLLGHDRFLEYLDRDSPALAGVFHLGACSSTTETDWEYLWRNNVEYSRKIWQWCARAVCPLVYASSAATYGDGSLGFDDRLLPGELRPLNPYGRSKNDFDRWALDEMAHGQPTPPSWAGVKFFNVYGAREAHKGAMASVVRQAYWQIRASGEVRLFRSNDPAYADGEQRRDFVFVEDCVDHLLWLWQRPHPPGLYNSGTGKARTFLDLTHAVFAALDIEPNVLFIDMPAAVARQYQNFTQADMSKLRAVGYDCPPTTLEQGVAATVERLCKGSA